MWDEFLRLPGPEIVLLVIASVLVLECAWLWLRYGREMVEVPAKAVTVPEPEIDDDDDAIVVTAPGHPPRWNASSDGGSVTTRRLGDGAPRHPAPQM